MRFFNLPSGGIAQLPNRDRELGLAIEIGFEAACDLGRRFQQDARAIILPVLPHKIHPDPPGIPSPKAAIPTIEHEHTAADDGITAQANKPPRNRLRRLHPRASRFTQSSPPSGKGGRVDLLPRNS